MVEKIIKKSHDEGLLIEKKNSLNILIVNVKNGTSLWVLAQQII